MASCPKRPEGDACSDYDEKSCLEALEELSDSIESLSRAHTSIRKCIGELVK